MEQKDIGKKDEIIAGRNAVWEALRSGRAIDSIVVARGNRTGAIAPILSKAKEKGVVIKEADPRKLILCVPVRCIRGSLRWRRRMPMPALRTSLLWRRSVESHLS